MLEVTLLFDVRLLLLGADLRCLVDRLRRLGDVLLELRSSRLSRDAANFTGLVLGCIETKFCK